METKKRRSICYGLLLVFCTICGLLSVVFSGDAKAIQLNSWLNIQELSKTNLSNDWIIRNHNNAGSYFVDGATSLQTSSIQASGALPQTVSGSAWSGSGHIYVKLDKTLEGGFICPNAVSVSIRPEQGTRLSENSRVVSCTHSQDAYYNIWDVYVETTGQLTQNSTISTFYISMVGSNSQPIISAVSTPGQNIFVFLSANINIAIGQDPSLNALGEINQNITIINNNIEQHYEQENQAYENISNQSPNDIEGAENQQTTNLIGVLSSFLTELRSFEATNCNLTLPLPEFVGGETTVNICQGKDVLGNFITIVGTLTMVTFYIPLAYLLLKMIYNEIRSFTNG